MWNQPYLETCCRSALHRLALAGDLGRPRSEKDAPCLDRLTELGFAVPGPDGRYRLTAEGCQRHDSEITTVPRR
jgi:hypothetical protein